MAVSKSFDGSQAKVHTALESLEKIKKQQAERAAKFEAQQELHQMGADDDALNHKLQAAGIVPAKSSADSVLLRLKAKQKNTDTAN
jgi:phage shock protein A